MEKPGFKVSVAEIHRVSAPNTSADSWVRYEWRPTHKHEQIGLTVAMERRVYRNWNDFFLRVSWRIIKKVKVQSHMLLTVLCPRCRVPLRNSERDAEVCDMLTAHSDVNSASQLKGISNTIVLIFQTPSFAVFLVLRTFSAIFWIFQPIRPSHLRTARSVRCEKGFLLPNCSTIANPFGVFKPWHNFLPMVGVVWASVYANQSFVLFQSNFSQKIQFYLIVL